MQWLEHQHTEPSTKRRLKRSRVVPNLTLRGMIEDWLAAAERRRAGGEEEDVPVGISRWRGFGAPAESRAAPAEPPETPHRARRRAYSELKRRAAEGVSAEEQRWAEVSRGRGQTGGVLGTREG
jgi:hypothetical protein